MKKTTIITSVIGACVIAASLAGCSGKTGTGETAQASLIGGGQTQISVEVSQAVVADGFKFSYMGYDIIPWAPAAPILDVLGEEQEYFEGMSCAGEEMAHIYLYPEFEFSTVGMPGEEEIIDGVRITNALIDFNGVHVGDKTDVAKNVFGTPVTEDDFGFKYSKGNTFIQINTDGADTIVEIICGRDVLGGAN